MPFMETELAVLCDAATESGGKLNILGAFDSIFSREFPATHPQCAIALRIRFLRIEAGPHRIRMNFVDADGRAVVPPLDTSATIQCGDEDESVVANLIVNFQQLKFEKPGRYAIDVAVDGRLEKSLPLTVKQVRPPEPTT